ncbi:hypothetical protein [Candidatus Binatus soli]|jgi:hypothetical protein|uniref:hypothetical protein n=1 Tax=Candidatus Binatus soli TaxID=1953413 RepID=UPI003D0C4F96
MLIQYEGQRCPDGYKLTPNRRQICARATATATYRPERNAFLRFTNPYKTTITGTQDEPRAMLRSLDTERMLSLANEFGLLGFAADGESVIFWRDAMMEIGEAVGNLAIVNWKGPAAIWDEQHDWAERRPAAAQHLRAALNRHLIGAPVGADIAEGRFRTVIRPDSLLTCLWAQLLESASGDGTTIRLCPGCNEWKEFGKRRTTCTNKCRVRVNERFQRRAIQLSRERKMKPAKIAETLRREGWRSAGDPVEQIMCWIKAPV